MSNSSLTTVPHITVVAPSGYEHDVAGLAENNLRYHGAEVSALAWSDFDVHISVSSILLVNDLLDPNIVDVPGIVADVRKKSGHKDPNIIVHNTRHSAPALEILEQGRVIVIGSMTSLRIALALLRK